MEKRRILFVCTENKDRSRRAEDLFKDEEAYDVKSAGVLETVRSPRVKISRELIQWADLIVAMGRQHKEVVYAFSPEAAGKTIVLDIPDDYDYSDERLTELLLTRLRRYDIIRACDRLPNIDRFRKSLNQFYDVLAQGAKVRCGVELDFKSETAHPISHRDPGRFSQASEDPECFFRTFLDGEEERDINGICYTKRVLRYAQRKGYDISLSSQSDSDSQSEFDDQSYIERSLSELLVVKIHGKWFKFGNGYLTEDGCVDGDTFTIWPLNHVIFNIEDSIVEHSPSRQKRTMDSRLFKQ